jgi:hypothetical protein
MHAARCSSLMMIDPHRSAALHQGLAISLPWSASVLLNHVFN